MNYIQKTLPYFILTISPVIIAFIIALILNSKIKYEIVTREIQPQGGYFVTICKSNNERVISYKTVDVSRETFYKIKRGKITKKLYTELGGD